uniref:Uncharacterized protein n=1 Tax=viral metagenome TaxID=1070528 RepID=A0A6C0JCP8_9ZZZZ
MKFNNILKKIIEFIDNDDNLCISEYIINDYLTLIKNKNTLYEKIEEISTCIANDIVIIIYSKYTSYPKWVINKYVNKNDIYLYAKDMLLNNKHLVKKIENLDNITINNPETYKLDESLRGLSLWKILLNIVFTDIKIDNSNPLFSISSFSDFYYRLKIIYNSFDIYTK